MSDGRRDEIGIGKAPFGTENVKSPPTSESILQGVKDAMHALVNQERARCVRVCHEFLDWARRDLQEAENEYERTKYQQRIENVESIINAILNPERGKIQ